MSYGYKRAITIDHDQITAPVAADSDKMPRVGWTASAANYYPGYPPSQAVNSNHGNLDFFNTADGSDFPHEFVVDFGSAQTFGTVIVDLTSTDGARIVDDWELYVSDDGATWGSAVASGTYGLFGTLTISLANNVTKRYIKFVGVTGDQIYMAIRDIWIAFHIAATDHYTNFPFLVSGTYDYLAHTTHGGKVTDLNGYDIIFTSDEDGLIQLDHEIDTYNHETGAVNFWIRIPSLPPDSDTVIWMWYGDAGVTTSQENKAGLWQDFLLVEHFGNGTTLSVADSAGNYTPTNQGATATTGKIGGGAAFASASSQYIDIGDYLNEFDPDDFILVQVWLNYSDTTHFQRVISNMTGVPYNGFDVYLNSDPEDVNAQCGSGGTLDVKRAGNLFASGAWIKLTLLFGYYASHFYYNDQGSTQLGIYQIGTSTNNAEIGRYPGGTANYFNGSMDELRLAKWDGKRILDQSYHLTERANQTNPATFYGVGDEVAVGSGAYSGQLTDVIPIISDAIGFYFVRHLTAGVSDTLRPASDRLFPRPIEAVHFTGDLADFLKVVLDAIGNVPHADRGGPLGDTLQVIRDSITAGKINLSAIERWVAPVSIMPRVSIIDPLYLAAHAVRHPTIYFEPRVKSYGIFTRAISAPAGFIKTGDVNLILLDPDNSLRQRIPAKTIRKARAEIRLGPEGGKLSSFLRPFNRQVETVSQPADGELSLQLRDQCFDFLERMVPSVITEANFPNLPQSSGPQFGNLVFGIVSGDGGALACPLVDTVNFRYFACRNIAKSVDAVYRKGSGDDDFVLVNPSEYSIVTTVWIEHEAGTGDYCTLIEFSVDQADAEIRADIQGIQDDAGNLTCTNFSDALLNAFEYLAWITNRMDALNLASFDATRIAVASLACAGALTEPITFGEFVSRMQRSSNIDVFADKNDRIAIHYTTDAETPAVNLDDVLRLYKGTVRQQLADPTFNRIPYRYAPNYASGKWTEDKWDNPADQTALGEVTEEEPLQMYYVRDAATALAVVQRRGEYLDLDAFRFEGEIPLIPVLENLELADLVGIEHFGGIKVGGYVAEQFKILELSMDVDQLKYNFKGIRRRMPPPNLVESTVVSGLAKTNARPGPFASEVEGELFAVFAKPVPEDNILRVWHSTDYGLTWTVADAANQPTLTVLGSYDCFAADGIIHIATQERATGRVAYHTFSMTACAWVTVDEQIIASASNGQYSCVSIETRYPGGEPVVYFQGDKQISGGSYWARGYYVIKMSGSWSAPALATPDPSTYPNDGATPGASSSCSIMRVIAGRDDRMHFFWQIDPSITGVRWSPDEYAHTLQADLSWGGLRPTYISAINYTTPRDMGTVCLNEDRTRIYSVSKAAFASGYVDRYSEGPDISILGSEAVCGQINWSENQTDNPTGFLKVIDGELYLVVTSYEWACPMLTQRTESAGAWSTPLATGPATDSGFYRALNGTV